MDALALLTLQIEWGADEALEDSPFDRLQPAAPARPAPPPAVPLHPQSDPGAPMQAVRPPADRATAPFASIGTAAERALAAAAAATGIDALRTAIAGFDGCVLRDTATNSVLADGDPTAGLLLISDPPGADEDRSGRPFAGEDGVLLDRMLASIGLVRGQLLMAPLIPWRPPGGRPPSAGELAVCLPFLHRLIVLAEPRHVLLFGPLAARSMLGGRRRAGSGWAELAAPGLPAPVPALVLPPPQLVRSSPKERREAWVELRRLRRALGDQIAES